MWSPPPLDTVVDAAVAAGAVDHDDAEDYGFRYSRSFFDLDGHGWQAMWMDPVAAELGPEEHVAQPQAGASASTTRRVTSGRFTALDGCIDGACPRPVSPP
jgi:hypothetical protein